MTFKLLLQFWYDQIPRHGLRSVNTRKLLLLSRHNVEHGRCNMNRSKVWKAFVWKIWKSIRQTSLREAIFVKVPNTIEKFCQTTLLKKTLGISQLYFFATAFSSEELVSKNLRNLCVSGGQQKAPYQFLPCNLSKSRNQPSKRSDFQF